MRLQVRVPTRGIKEMSAFARDKSRFIFLLDPPGEENTAFQNS